MTEEATRKGRCSPDKAARQGPQLGLEAVGELPEVVVLVADDPQQVAQRALVVLAVAPQVLNQLRVEARHPGARAQRAPAALLKGLQQALVLLGTQTTHWLACFDLST